MSLQGAYDPDNIFARIIRGEIRSVKVFEDERVLTILDAFPQARGHSLVLHKRSRARNLLEIEPEALNEVMAAVRKTARALAAALKPEGLVVTQFNGAPAGQTIFHLHVHLIPRYEGEATAGHGKGIADPAALRALAQQIAAAMPD